MKSNNSKNKAEQVLNRLNIRNPSELIIRDIAMDVGIFVKEEQMDSSEGRLLRKGNLGIVTINRNIPEEGRKRFAIAHEIGHFELHSDSQLILCTDKDMNMVTWKGNNHQEIEANEFAANILMPSFLFLPFLQKKGMPDIKSIILLAGEFRTSLTATALRYVELSKEPCAIVISKNNIIKWYRKSSYFDYHIKVGEKVDSESYAFECFNTGYTSDRPESVPASAWIAGNVHNKSEIIESSFPLPIYNTVLSLLWINEEIERY